MLRLTDFIIRRRTSVPEFRRESS